MPSPEKIGKELDIIFGNGHTPEQQQKELRNLVLDWVNSGAENIRGPETGARIALEYDDDFNVHARVTMTKKEINWVFSREGEVCHLWEGRNKRSEKIEEKSPEPEISITDSVQGALEETEGDLEQRLDTILRNGHTPTQVIVELKKLVLVYIARPEIGHLIGTCGRLTRKKLSNGGTEVTVTRVTGDTLETIGVFDEMGNHISVLNEVKTKQKERKQIAVSKPPKNVARKEKPKRNPQESEAIIKQMQGYRIRNAKSFTHKNLHQFQQMLSSGTDFEGLVESFRTDTQSGVRLVLKLYGELPRVPRAQDVSDKIGVSLITLRKLEQRIVEFINNPYKFKKKEKNNAVPTMQLSGSELATTEFIGEYYQANYSKLLNYAKKYAAKGMDAEGILQDAFIAVMKVIENGKELTKSGFAAYLYRTISNKAIDRRRKKGNNGIPFENDDEEGQDFASVLGMPQKDEPDQRTIAKEEFLDLMDYMERKLTPQEKEVMTFLQEGASYKEIATATGLTVSNVGFIIHSVRHKIG